MKVISILDRLSHKESMERPGRDAGMPQASVANRHSYDWGDKQNLMIQPECTKKRLQMLLSALNHINEVMKLETGNSKTNPTQ